MSHTPSISAEEDAAGIEGQRSWADSFETAAFAVLVITLAWAPFPLGSNRPWSWSLLVIMVTLAWCLWLLSVWNAPTKEISALRPLAVPFVLAGGTLIWAFVQTISFVPESWVHPLWGLADTALSSSTARIVSLDSWATRTAIMKLMTYGATAWLAYRLSFRTVRAQQLLNALIMIGAFYALYALAMGMIGMRQVELFYDSAPFGSRIAAPFVSDNNFATYAGLAMLCACVRLFQAGAQTVTVGRGLRRFVLSFIKFLTDRGLLPLLAFLPLFSMLIASGSRAGFLSALMGTLVLVILSSRIAQHRSTIVWATLGIVVMASVAIVLFFLGGDILEAQFNALVEAGGVDPIRLTLWDAAHRMIADAPWLGLGLGTFESAYQLYATEVFPYVMDKAHNDYLEFAAGLGLPAAIAWWMAILWLALLCVRGVFVRRRNRAYPLLAVGATALVGFHSAFDFSLQIPAVALSYAAILGLGVAQAFPTRMA